jgi:hypothetical protein
MDRHTTILEAVTGNAPNPWSDDDEGWKSILMMELIYVRFQVLTVASMKIGAFWDIAPCSFIGVDWHFRGVYCLQSKGDE